MMLGFSHDFNQMIPILEGLHPFFIQIGFLIALMTLEAINLLSYDFSQKFAENHAEQL